MPTIYARVSTGDQDFALQLDALKKAGCKQVFQDCASGAKSERPDFTAALGYLREGDLSAGSQQQPASKTIARS